MFLFCFFLQVPNQNDMEANNETIGTVYFTIEGKQATNVFSLVSAEGDVTKPEPTQPNYNGVGMVTTTVSYIALIILNGVIIARLAIAL